MRVVSPDGLTKLARLIETLDQAERAIEEIGSDPLLRRLLEAIRLMPAEDREVIVGAIEREVKARRLSRATQGMTGQAMHPNPHARLYLRSHQKAVPRNLFERDDLMLAMLSAFRVTPILTVPEIHAEWMEATQAALEHVEPATLKVVEQLLREALAMVTHEGSAPPSGLRAQAG